MSKRKPIRSAQRRKRRPSKPRSQGPGLGKALPSSPLSDWIKSLFAGLPDRKLSTANIRVGEPLQFPPDFPKFPAEIAAYGEKMRASLSPDARRAQLNHHFEMGHRFFESGQYSKAVPEYQRSLVLMTEEMAGTAVIFNLAQCYANLRRVDDYHATMRFYMKLEPDDPQPYFSLAYQALLKENHEEVIRLTKEGRKRVKGRDAAGLLNMARAYASLGRYQESLRTLEEAIRIAPDWADAYQALGACYEDMLDIEQAKKYYRKAAELDPTRRANLERLEQGIIITGVPPAWLTAELGDVEETSEDNDD